MRSQPRNRRPSERATRSVVPLPGERIQHHPPRGAGVSDDPVHQLRGEGRGVAEALGRRIPTRSDRPQVALPRAPLEVGVLTLGEGEHRLPGLGEPVADVLGEVVGLVPGDHVAAPPALALHQRRQHPPGHQAQALLGHVVAAVGRGRRPHPAGLLGDAPPAVGVAPVAPGVAGVGVAQIKEEPPRGRQRPPDVPDDAPQPLHVGLRVGLLAHLVGVLAVVSALRPVGRRRDAQVDAPLREGAQVGQRIAVLDAVEALLEGLPVEGFHPLGRLAVDLCPALSPPLGVRLRRPALPVLLHRLLDLGAGGVLEVEGGGHLRLLTRLQHREGAQSPLRQHANWHPQGLLQLARSEEPGDVWLAFPELSGRPLRPRAVAQRPPALPVIEVDQQRPGRRQVRLDGLGAGPRLQRRHQHHRRPHGGPERRRHRLHVRTSTPSCARTGIRGAVSPVSRPIRIRPRPGPSPAPARYTMSWPRPWKMQSRVRKVLTS